MKQQAIDPANNVAGLCDHAVVPGKLSLLMMLYAPIGVLLLAFRLLAIFLFYAISFVSPGKLKKPLYRLQLRALGVRLNTNLPADNLATYTKGCVVAANHVSVMDAFVSLGLPNATIMIGHPIHTLDLFGRIWYTSATELSQARCWHVVDRRALVKHIQAWRKQPEGTTLYTTPEMTLNNQRGLFRFNPAFMAFDMPVIPLAIRADNPLGINLCPVTSSRLAITVRMLMLPGVVFSFNYLERKVRDEGESKDAFARRVQRAIAEALDIPATDWTAADKHAYRKALQDKSNLSQSHNHA